MALGDFFLQKEKPGAVFALEEAEEQELVSRTRAVPEGGVLPERTDYRKPPPPLEWPERYKESLPILLDPFLRAASLSTHISNWEHITKGFVDQLLTYGMHNFPISRPDEDVVRQLQKGHCQSTFQLSLLVCNLGNLCRPMQFAGKRCKYTSGSVQVSSDPAF